MPPGRDDVRSRGKTGSRRPTAKMTRLTHFGHLAAWPYAPKPLRSSMSGKGSEMKRREFIAGIGVAATWPMVARAQQKSKPVIGVLNGGGIDPSEPRAWGLRAFGQGLRE